MSALKSRKRLNLQSSENEDKATKGIERNMTVAVRIRPLSQREIDAGHNSCCNVVNGSIVAIRKGGNAAMYLRSQQGSLNEYCFDAAFDPTCSQLEIYEKTAKPMIPTLLEGYNVTVFAYGATGAGKTHTMMGSSRGDDARNGSDAGIIPNALSDVFSLISLHQTEALPTESWTVSVSFMEVYNEQVFDLLEPTGKVLSVREDPERGMVIVAGLTQQPVAATDHVLQLLVNGNKNRKTESTMANQVSSRSHAILQLMIKHRYHSSSGQEMNVETVLSLIDLAGSERASATNNTGTRLQEGANINKSLLALANCINALSSSSSSFSSSSNSQGSNGNGNGSGVAKKQNVKYRDSKLTHLLKSSLEGHCHVIMIANINPSHVTFEDSHNTLKYANRAKNIKINPLLSSSASADSLLSSSSLTQQEIAQWMQREQGLREENKELRLKIEELNEMIQELSDLQQQGQGQEKKKTTKCCVCGLEKADANTATDRDKQKERDENANDNTSFCSSGSSSLSSPLPSKSPLRPNSSPLSPLASKKYYSSSSGGATKATATTTTTTMRRVTLSPDAFAPPSPDSFSTLEIAAERGDTGEVEGGFQYPSIEQLSEALEDPLCLSEDLLSDHKITRPSSSSSHQLKSRIAQLSVITQKQQEMFQNILEDTEKLRRDSVGMRRRRSSIATTANRQRTKLMSDQEPQPGTKETQTQSRRASLPLGAQIFQDLPDDGSGEGREETKDDMEEEVREEDTLASAPENLRKRRYSLVPSATRGYPQQKSINASSSVLKDRSNTATSSGSGTSVFKDPIQTEKTTKKLRTEEEGARSGTGSDENVNNTTSKNATLNVNNSKLRRNSISATSSKRRLARRAI